MSGIHHEIEGLIRRKPHLFRGNTDGVRRDGIMVPSMERMTSQDPTEQTEPAEQTTLEKAKQLGRETLGKIVGSPE